MHSKGKGISDRATPYKRSAPSWCKATPADVVDSICKLARKGVTPSQIGVVLRDSHGIPQVRRPRVVALLRAEPVMLFPRLVLPATSPALGRLARGAAHAAKYKLGRRPPLGTAGRWNL
jgi:hypothetical protein